MKIAFFDTKEFELKEFKEHNKNNEITFFDENLSLENIDLTSGYDAVCSFVNTPGDKEILKGLKERNVNVWLQRSMGYNKIDLKAAQEYGIHVFRVPNYSAASIAEHAVTLLMSVNRKIVKANKKIENYDFSLSGLVGKCINGSTVGVIGAGQIGQHFIKAMKGMGAKVVIFDDFLKSKLPPFATKDLDLDFVSLDELLEKSDFISLHAPLLNSTKHIINKEAIKKMKNGVIIINTSRGPLINTSDLIEGIKEGKIAGAGLDVLEREEGRFFFDKSKEKEEIKDEEWEYLINNEKILITAHQAFLTKVALQEIAKTTLENANDAEKQKFEKTLKLQEDGKVLNG